MTTPSKYRRLNEAADLYLEFGKTTMMLCEAIKKLHGNIKVEGPDGEHKTEIEEVAAKVAGAIESEFHRVLDPYVTRLEEIDQAIKANLPKPPGSIILPGNIN